MSLKEIAGVVVTGDGRLLVETPEALTALVAALKSQGYEDQSRRGGDAEEPYTTWHYRLRDDVFERKGKCGFCEALIDMTGIHAHNRTCEVCGKIICKKFVDGGVIEFAFGRLGEPLSKSLSLRIRAYDEESERLILYADPLEPIRILNVFKAEEIPGELAERAAAGYCELVVIDDEQYISIPYRLLGGQETTSVSEIRGQFLNATVVKLYDGVEYDDMFGQLPIPESYTVKAVWS